MKLYIHHTVSNVHLKSADNKSRKNLYLVASSEVPEQFETYHNSEEFRKSQQVLATYSVLLGVFALCLQHRIKIKNFKVERLNSDP